MVNNNHYGLYALIMTPFIYLNKDHVSCLICSFLLESAQYKVKNINPTREQAIVIEY